MRIVFNKSVYNYAQLKNKSVMMAKLRSVHSSYLHILRYADSFVVIGYSKYILKAWVLPKIIQFLKERGLELSLKKTKLLGLRDRSKLDFLGYTFRYVNKGCPGSKAIPLNYLALYQRKFNFAQTVNILKHIFHKSLNLSAYSLIAKVNFVLRG